MNTKVENLLDIINERIVFLISLFPIRLITFILSHCKLIIKFFFGFPSRGNMRNNFNMALKDKNISEIENLIKDCEKHYLKTKTEQWIFTDGELRKLYKILKNTPISIKYKENLDKALAMQKGVILLSAHIGAFFLLPSILAYWGYNINIVGMLSEKDRKMLEKKAKILKGSVKILPLTHIKSIIKCLQSNEIVIILGDRVFHETNNNYFFYGHLYGHLIHIPGGHIWLNMKTAAPIVPAFLIRKSNNELNLFIEKSLNLEFTQKVKKEILYEKACEVYKIISSYIYQYPSQWIYWGDFHNMIYYQDK